MRSKTTQGIVAVAVASAIVYGATALTDSHGGHYARRALTPGTTFPHVTAADVCSYRWASTHRHVTHSERLIVFAAYDIPYSNHRRYELDHLIPLELGGNNATTNLWPQPWSEARVKDRVGENDLHDQVCNGRRTLASAWHLIRRTYTR